MGKSIAFFDFDGTVTRKDTMLELIRFSAGSLSYYKGFIKLLPWLVGMKLGRVPNSVAKEKMLSLFFRDMPLEKFNLLCKEFSEKKLPGLIRPDALEALEKHKASGHEVVVVSASAENWIGDWCKNMGIPVLATKLEIDNKNRITGKLNGLNCNGAEKISRIKQSFDPAAYENIYCYGDSDGDRQMLSIATHPYYKHFKG